MAVVKWTITDGDTTVALAYNPVSMSSTFGPKNLSVSTRGDLVTMQPAPAFEWTFEGNVYSDEEYNKLVLWHEKDMILELTDHLGRTWRVVSSALEITDRKTTRNNSERYTYSWTVLNLGLNGQISRQVRGNWNARAFVNKSKTFEWNAEED